MVAWPFQPGGAQAAYFGPIVDRQLDSILLLRPRSFFDRHRLDLCQHPRVWRHFRTSSCADCHALCPSLVADVFASSMVIASPGERSWSRAGCWFAVTWVLGEALRATVLTGFPWLLVGTAHVNTIFAGWAPLGSVFLVSGVIALFAELLILGLGRPRLGSVSCRFTGSMGLLMVTVWVSVIEWTEPRGCWLWLPSGQFGSAYEMAEPPV